MGSLFAPKTTVIYLKTLIGGSFTKYVHYFFSVLVRDWTIEKRLEFDKCFSYSMVKLYHFV